MQPGAVRSRTALGALASLVLLAPSLGIGAPGEKTGDPPAVDRPDALPDARGRTFGDPDSVVVDSLADSVAVVLDVPRSFDPSGLDSLRFLVPDPFGQAADTLFGISTFDAFLAPPVGPTRVHDRQDLRLSGSVEMGERLADDPAIAVRPPGYPGTVPAVSMHGHGPGGTAFVFGGHHLEGGLGPLPNPNPISTTSLAGLAVLPVTGSHLAGPGAGGGIVHALPLVTAPARPFSEVTTAQGIFGQRRGSITLGQRFGDVGLVYDYRGASARPWSLFDGYRSERHFVALDLTRGRVRVSAQGRITDQRLLGFDRVAKRSDDGRAGSVALEARLAPGLLGALRVFADSPEVRADGLADGFGRRTLARRGGELLLWQRGRRSSVGLLAAVQRDRLGRLVRGEPEDEREETTGHGVLRGSTWLGGTQVDLSGRIDRTVNREWAWAAGGTASRPVGKGTLLWLHGGRTVDRATYVHTLTDAFTQVEQGQDLPFRDGGQPLLSGWQSAAGLRLDRGRLSLELAGVVGRREHLVGEDPDAHLTALALDEPTAFEVDEVDDRGGWARVVVEPLPAGFLGTIRLEAAGYLGAADDGVPRTADPRQHGHVGARLRRAFFGDHLWAEGELILRAHGQARSAFGPLPAVSWLDARIAIRVVDLLFTYRSENVLGADVLSLAYDESLGYVPITNQNIQIGISWILLD